MCREILSLQLLSLQNWIGDVSILENSKPEFEVHDESLLIEFWRTVSSMVVVLHVVRMTRSSALAPWRNKLRLKSCILLYSTEFKFCVSQEILFIGGILKLETSQFDFLANFCMYVFTCVSKGRTVSPTAGQYISVLSTVWSSPLPPSVKWYLLMSPPVKK